MSQARLRVRAGAAVLLAAGSVCLALWAATAPARGATPVVTAPAASILAAADPDADTGGASPGESADPWAGVLPFIGWIVLGLTGAGLLVWMTIGASRRRAPAAEGPPDGAPAPSPVARPFDPSQDRDLAALVFDHVAGAEHAFAAVLGRAGDAPWMREVAFMECHRNGRIVVRGVFAGHWLDVEDAADEIGHDTVAGAAAGAIVDAALGPAGLEPGSSALVALAGTDDADAFVGAFGDHPARRHHLSSADMAALMTAVSGAPPAAPPLTTRGADR